MKRAFRLAYDGRPFHGFQRQPDVPTVEGVLLDALCALSVLDPGAEVPEGYSAAGRTDAGVSAVAQTVAFDCPGWCTPRALNSELPGSVRAWASADVDAGFHATHDARRRIYRYHLHAPGADDGRAAGAADRLSGEHDFGNLTPDDRGTVRELSVGVERDGGFLAVTVAASGFPRQLVRRLVSLLGAVATGETPLSRIDRVLAAEPLPGAEGVAPAPAHPLVLAAVEYDVAFEVDPEAAASARAAFGGRRIEGATLARVAGSVLDGLG